MQKEYEVQWGQFVQWETEERYGQQRLTALKQSTSCLHIAVAAMTALAAALDFSQLPTADSFHLLGLRAIVIATQAVALLALGRLSPPSARQLGGIYTAAMVLASLGFAQIASTYLQATGRSDYSLVLGLGGAVLVGLHPAAGKRTWPLLLALGAALAWTASTERAVGIDPLRSVFTVLVLHAVGVSMNIALHSRGRLSFAASEQLSRAEAELTRLTRAEAQAARLELGRRNDEWQAVVDCGQLLVLFVNRSGTVAFANDLAIAAGIECGDDFFSWLNLDSKAMEASPIADAFSNGSCRDLEAECIVDGAPRTYALRAAPVGGDCPMKTVTIIGLDITESKKLSNELLRAQRQQVVGALVGGITHDFNNLLMVIIGSAEVVRSGGLLEPERRQFLDELLEASASAAKLTRQLLLFSRRQPNQALPVEMNQLITDLARLLGRMVGKQVEIELVLCQTPVWVQADPSHLEQMLMNLAVNARDSMPEGGSIRIETQPVRGGVQVDISDDGEGIAAEILPQVFDPFFTTKSELQGTGLGLATVKGVVEQIGGTIEVQSTVGQGTRFRTWLPLGEKSQLISHEPSTPLAARRTVLLVDDNRAVLKATRAMLQRQNYEVLVANESAQALDIAARHPSLDLLLTDVHLPGENGIQLAAAIALHAPNTSVVFMSGYVDDPEFLQEVASGHHVLLDKPFSAPQLYDTLDSAFASHPPRG